jgi:MFS family permease
MTPAQTRRILVGLIFPAMLMPLVSTMSRVALPMVRDHFALGADTTAWIDVAFTLPFMILMPVYGRLSDGLGPRRLILLGIAIFSVGTLIILTATGLGGILLGRAVQGIGLAGMMPLGMALVTAIFPPKERGRALGTWSTVGPTTGFLGPLAAGFMVAAWGWEGAYAPPLLFGLIAVIAVLKAVPARPATADFLRRFDWGGVGLLAVALSALVFFLSSRAATGVAPLRDWRLAAIAIVFLALFVWWERRRAEPFIHLSLLGYASFLRGSFCASLRMVVMGGIGILAPLYLVDIKGVRPAELGGLLMIGSGSMALVVRLAGALADRWSGRWFTVAGLLLQTASMLIFWRLPAASSMLWVVLALAVQGLGAGLMLATLHRSVMADVPQTRLGAAAGLYSMLRFLGAVTGTALGGVLLQGGLDTGMPQVQAYQQVFLIFAAFPVLGALLGLNLKD